MLEAKRETKAARRKELCLRDKVREEEQATAANTVAGIDLREELDKLWSSKAAQAARKRYQVKRSAGGFRFGLLEKPSFHIRRAKRKPWTRLGFAWRSGKSFQVTDYPGITEHDIRETFAHELAHCLTPGTVHGPAFYRVFFGLCEEVYGYRPKRETRYHGELSKTLRTRAFRETSNQWFKS